MQEFVSPIMLLGKEMGKKIDNRNEWASNYKFMMEMLNACVFMVNSSPPNHISQCLAGVCMGSIMAFKKSKGKMRLKGLL